MLLFTLSTAYFLALWFWTCSRCVDTSSCLWLYLLILYHFNRWITHYTNSSRDMIFTAENNAWHLENWKWARGSGWDFFGLVRPGASMMHDELCICSVQTSQASVMRDLNDQLKLYSRPNRPSIQISISDRTGKNLNGSNQRRKFNVLYVIMLLYVIDTR